MSRTTRSTTPVHSHLTIEVGQVGQVGQPVSPNPELDEEKENQSLVLQFATILIILLYDHFSFFLVFVSFC